MSAINICVIGFIILGCFTAVGLIAYIVCLLWNFLFRCWHLRTKPYDIGFDQGICCADCGRMLS